MKRGGIRWWALGPEDIGLGLETRELEQGS